MSMKEDRAREGKKARYRKMGFGPMMDKGEIDFGDKHPLTKKRLKNFKKKDDAPMSDERFYQQRKAEIGKAGLKASKMLTGGQAKIAAKAPPPNKIDEKDFAVLRAEKAKGRGMGLQDEKVQPGKVMKARMGKDVSYKNYLKGLKKATSEVKGSRGSSKINPTTLKAALMKSKNAYSDLVKTTAKGPKRYSSMKEMREAKGFKPGESASNFNKRRMALEAGKKALKATTAGKIALGIGALGIGAKKYLESKMKKKKELEGDIKGSTAPYKVKKKMGGGMMQKPMGYKSGTMVKARGCKLGRTRPTKIT